ncbi:box C/D snoRNA protein 1 [Echinops telfairi]|uniref:Box C/D snoRNA protein 1 n=1 Tax=Echinops telfairi TaxID=9371 RepID=A0ABM0IG68_ECHTE|nr:box C/D snoRNA protein 1 [Echinops telfairi]
MEFAAGNEGPLGGDCLSGAEGAELRPESCGEGGKALAGMPEACGGKDGGGLTGVWRTGDGEDGSGQRTDDLRVDLAAVKQESPDWLKTEDCKLDAQGVKQAVEDGPEVKDEKAGTFEVKQEMDASLLIKEEKVGAGAEIKEEKVKVKEEAVGWLDMKEEEEVKFEIKKEEVVADQSVKQEEMMVGDFVKEEKAVVKQEVMDDTKLNDESTVNPVSYKRKLAMSRCETCGTEEAKYRCPRCMRYSCSLPCVKKHKAELTCNGVRDKTAFVSIKQFTEMNLLSDYRFLEDVARTADYISRDTFLKRPMGNKHMHFLKNRARRQGICLKLLPNGFTKRKENSTFFDKKNQQFCWHVKLLFPQSQAVYIEKRVPDNRTINEILRTYIDPEKSDPVIRQRLKVYIHSQAGVQILMKVECVQQNVVSYHELDPSKSLLENLKNKVIMEYPTLHVVLKGSSSNMKVLHQMERESTRRVGSEN